MEENIGRALLIAAGMLIAVMILSMLVLGYNEISNFYNEQSEATRIEQVTEFNNQFLNYQRDNLRGTEVLTLVNKVIDYNERQSYEAGTGYERIIMTINMGNTSSNFIIETDIFSVSADDLLIAKTMTNKNNESDNLLLSLTGAEAQLIQDAKTVGISNLTSGKLQKLSSNISPNVSNHKEI